MERTILVGDHLLVNKFAYAPRLPALKKFLPYRDVKPGDIIVFKKPGDDMNPGNVLVKRAVAQGGDTVQVRDKRLFVNEKPSDDAPIQHIDPETYPDDPTVPDMARRRDQFGPFQVAPNSFFGMGDNRDNSLDSRYWGSIPRGNIFGRPSVLYWSYEAEPNSHIWKGRSPRFASSSTCDRLLRGRDRTRCLVAQQRPGPGWLGHGSARPLQDRADPLVAAVVCAFARLLQAFAVEPVDGKNVLRATASSSTSFYAPSTRSSPDCCPRPVRAAASSTSASSDPCGTSSSAPGSETVTIRDRTVYVDGRPLSDRTSSADDRVWPTIRAFPGEGRRDQLAPTRSRRAPTS
jgi:signal peptidase I